jgi:uncharacterized oxidoreductase
MVARNKGVALPDGVIIDGAGQPSLDPGDLYGTPPGAILPFGAHKGYGLAVFCDLLSGVLSGGGCNHPGNPVEGAILNNMLSIILDPAPSGTRTQASAEVEAFIDWLKSSRPLGQGGEVLVPGEPERRTRRSRTSEGVPLDDTSWADIVRTAEEVGLARSEIDDLAHHPGA